MKKIVLAFLAVVVNMSMFSCDKDAIAEDEVVIQACCGGDDGDIPPPPPPPPDN